MVKTTLVIDDDVMARLKVEAARQDRTLSDLVESAIRRMLETPTIAPDDLPELPSYRLGPFAVDVADRDALELHLDDGERRTRRLGLA